MANEAWPAVLLATASTGGRGPAHGRLQLGRLQQASADAEPTGQARAGEQRRVH